MERRHNDESALAVLSVLSLLIIAYSLLVVQQILLGVVVVTFIWFAYAFWRLVRRVVGILDRIATALEVQVERDDRDSRR